MFSNKKNNTVEVKDLGKTEDGPDLKWVDRISILLDSKFTIPGTNTKFGLDPIFSLVPIIGDLSTFVVSLVLIHTMYRHGASGKLVYKMVFNATLDALIGSIPIAGTVFDLFFKSNERNIRLLRKYYAENGSRVKGKTKEPKNLPYEKTNPPYQKKRVSTDKLPRLKSDT